jgi:hypothetical protein
MPLTEELEAAARRLWVQQHRRQLADAQHVGRKARCLLARHLQRGSHKGGLVAQASRQALNLRVCTCVWMRVGVDACVRVLRGYTCVCDHHRSSSCHDRHAEHLLLLAHHLCCQPAPPWLAHLRLQRLAGWRVRLVDNHQVAALVAVPKRQPVQQLQLFQAQLLHSAALIACRGVNVGTCLWRVCARRGGGAVHRGVQAASPHRCLLAALCCCGCDCSQACTLTSGRCCCDRCC